MSGFQWRFSALVGTSSRSFLLLLFVALVAMLMQACGGGGGGSNDKPVAQPQAAQAAPIQGYVVKGPVASASVTLYQVASDGSRQALATTLTDKTGAYAFERQPDVGAMFMIEARGGQYVDEVTGLTVALSAPLRAVGVWAGNASLVSPSPLSEVAVRFMERTTPTTWTPALVRDANARFADWVGIADVLSFRPVDLTVAQSLGEVSEDDLIASIYLGAFSGFVHRLPAVPGVSALDHALDKFYSLVTSTTVDDEAMPAFILGMVDFMDRAALPETAKQDFKTIVLTAGGQPVPGMTLSQMLPVGVSSGRASATMPDDQFLVVPSLSSGLPPSGDAPRGTLFNDRGALVAYQPPGTDTRYRTLYSASVADVYGDGDVGFGRWNGGVALRATRSGRDMVDPDQPEWVPQEGEDYVVARPATQLPSCGLLTLAPVASAPPLMWNGGSHVGPKVPSFTGLSPDSRIAVQYIGGVAHLGVDIGLLLTGGGTQQFTSQGGLSAPWSSGFKVDANGRFRIGFSDAPGLQIVGVLSGAGGHKVILRAQLTNTVYPVTEQVQVFNAPDAQIDKTGCATSAGSTGQGVSLPLPVSGAGYVLWSPGISTTGGQFTVNFGAQGQLVSANRATDAGSTTLTIPNGTPTYDLAGNADAVIGRAGGDFLAGQAGQAFVPYFVGKPTAALPTIGSRHYQLVASTGVVSDLSNAAGSELALGQVSSAVADISFDQSFPPGSIPPTMLQAVVGVTIKGTLGGLPFTVTNPVGQGLFILRRPDSIIDDGPVFGVIAGGNAQYVALVFRVNVGGVGASGAVLLRAVP